MRTRLILGSWNYWCFCFIIEYALVDKRKNFTHFEVRWLRVLYFVVNFSEVFLFNFWKYIKGNKEDAYKYDLL